MARKPPPGIEKPRRFRPKFHYELIVCGTRGHELVGLDAAELRPEDALYAREDADGLRWYRCLRCDSWLPLERPENPTRRYPPARDQIELPLRGKALRDKIVLRLIAIDRAIHFVVLAAHAVVILLFAKNAAHLRQPVYKALNDLQSGLGGPARKHGVINSIRHLFSLEQGTLTKIGLIVSVYAVIEGLEAVGLWLQKRWAEYLTFIATTALIPLEVYEIATKGSPLKVFTLIINVAVVAYLLWAKRLFGIRGGARAEHEERMRDSGWQALESVLPSPHTEVRAG